MPLAQGSIPNRSTGRYHAAEFTAVFFGVVRGGAMSLSAFVVIKGFLEVPHISKELLINEEIRDREIRVIGDDGSQLGIMPTREALKIAAETKS